MSKDNNVNCGEVATCDSCYSCRWCYSCDSCYSCYSCDSCDSCYSCRSCRSLIRGLFCYEFECAKNVIFNKQVTEERFYEVRNKYQELLGDWEPRQTNGYELYKKAGSWEKIDISQFKTISWLESWKDMPKAAIQYLQSLPEFDEKIFNSITGLNAVKDDVTEEAIILKDGKKYRVKVLEEIK